MTTMALAVMTMANLQQPVVPVRGLHLMGPSREQVDACAEFIRKDLPKEGVNLLVLEVDWNFRFTKRPEMAEPNGLGPEEARKIADACKEAGVRLIPQINLLGHQSWAENTGKLLTVHPEFDETPGKYEKNKGIYCRSYCPSHPGVHAVVFDLIDEMADAFGADAFHVGMDEVFILGDPDCARCKGKSKAELFAGEVTKLRDHLKSKGREMWMWGDRFLDGKVTGLGEWEASTNDTAPAVNLVPKDVVICDWHYENAPPTPAWFATQGFRVVASPWRNEGFALSQLEQVVEVRKGGAKAIADRMLGVLHTTWCDFGSFLKAYRGEETGVQAKEAVACFKALMRAARGSD